MGQHRRLQTRVCCFTWSPGFTRCGRLDKYYFKEDLMLPFKVKEARLSAVCVSISHFPLSLLLFFDLPTNTFCIGNMFCITAVLSTVCLSFLFSVTVADTDLDFRPAHGVAAPNGKINLGSFVF